MPHVAVLMGGFSSERDVSLRSGKACAAALQREGFWVTKIDVGADIYKVLGRAKPDIVFNALHGGAGENGSIQGLLEIMGIPYTHSGVRASAIAMHKQQAKLLLSAAGVPVPNGCVVNRADAAEKHILHPPYVLKPVSEGSSNGVIFVLDESMRPPAKELSEPLWRFGDELIAEEYVPGLELSCAVFSGRSLGVIEINPISEGWYSYGAKYNEGGSFHTLPAEIPCSVYDRAQRIALRAHSIIGCRGVSRTDFRYNARAKEKLTVLEVNTQPGMTETSLVPELAAFAGISFDHLVKSLIEDASCNR